LADGAQQKNSVTKKENILIQKRGLCITRKDGGEGEAGGEESVVIKK